MIRIESKFIAESEVLVTEHRRLVTPFFFIRLKSRTYYYRESVPYVIYWPLFFCGKRTGWSCGDEWIIHGISKKEDKALAGIELAVSEFKPSNVVQFRAKG